ncbi:MAG: molybdate ABC transporter substrate-binding protein [Bauldia sp.]|nr:molybdate ABC transporter substrate-binding protein [Bauldia sp.]
MPHRTLRAFAVGFGLAVAVPVVSAPAVAEPVTVFAAASLQTALDTIAAAWQTEAGGTAVISYAASSALARQIEQGAPAQVFMSADLDWMNYLAERNLIDATTRSELLRNSLVLVAPVGTPPVEITPALDLAGLLGTGRLAVADTAAVPAGRYAKAALETLGLWAGVADRLAEAENVRAALALVSRGEAPLGIVYATDDVADPAVIAIGAFPEETHPPIVYPMALIAGTTNPDAAAFLEYLRGVTAQCLFLAQGFVVLAADGTVAPAVACPAAP